jgi:CheY-like chemotaxis protein
MNGPPTRVVLADDEPEFRALMAEYLARHGFEVTQASNGLETLLQVKRSRPSAIVLDLNMPRLGGLEALKRIRAFDPGIRVVVVTGEADEQIHRQALAQGACGVLRKPVALPDLLAALGSPGAPPNSTAPAAAPPATGPSLPAAAPRVLGVNDDPEVPAELLGRSADPSPAPARILLVDDDADMRNTLQELLASHGFEVATAANGDLAMQAIARRTPDVILLDIMMPGLSGVETLQTIRTIAPRVKVIMVSGGTTPAQGMRALALGAFDFVTKPVDVAYLLQSVDTALVMKELETSLSHAALRSRRIDET